MKLRDLIYQTTFGISTRMTYKKITFIDNKNTWISKFRKNHLNNFLTIEI